MPAPAQKRIQRKRTRGWRMPPGAVYVGRGTKWGNPVRIVRHGEWWMLEGIPCCMAGYLTRRRAAYAAAAWYKSRLLRDPMCRPLLEAARRELRGKDLCCWCGLDDPCHGDVLLKVANLEGV